MVTDNGGGNDNMIAELTHHLGRFRGSKSQIRCLAHVINLAAGVSDF